MWYGLIGTLGTTLTVSSYFINRRWAPLTEWLNKIAGRSSAECDVEATAPLMFNRLWNASLIRLETQSPSVSELLTCRHSLNTSRHFRDHFEAVMLRLALNLEVGGGQEWRWKETYLRLTVTVNLLRDRQDEGVYIHFFDLKVIVFGGVTAAPPVHRSGLYMCSP